MRFAEAFLALRRKDAGKESIHFLGVCAAANLQRPNFLPRGAPISAQEVDFCCTAHPQLLDALQIGTFLERRGAYAK